MIWIETPANPILRLTDIAAVASLARQHDLLLAVDSTFATPVATRPLQLGADFVVHSLTKYIGGHGDALGGAVLGGKERLEPLRTRALGACRRRAEPLQRLADRARRRDPAHSHARPRNGRTASGRVSGEPSSRRARQLSGLASHPQHALATRQMANYSGMLSFQAPDGPALAKRMAKELETIHFAVSLGHHRSLIYWIDTDAMMDSTFQLTGKQLAGYREFAGDGLFRLSVGLEDAEDLCDDLDRVLGGT